VSVPADPPPLSTRVLAVDAARGAALVGMIVYHAVWDLGLLGLADPPPAEAPGWRLFARIVAASFLVLVGVSLVLASRNGLDRRRYLRRLAAIGAAAAAVTTVTFFAVPNGVVVFGILHHVVVASVLALPFLRAPLWIVIGTALAVLAAPAVVDQPGLGLIGLGALSWPSVDHVPLFPWFSAVLAGIALARLGPLRVRVPDTRTMRALAAFGRRSLIVYLVHQPVLLGVLWAASFALPPAVEREFVASCRQSCEGSGRDPASCTRICACTAETARRERLFRAPDAEARLAAAARLCARAE
jgi:uncharacterized membrane protein